MKINITLNTIITFNLLIFVSGCAAFGDSKIKPSSVLPVQNPTLNVSQWAEQASDELPDTDWVQSFGSENLTAVIAAALSANPDVLGALALLDASRASAVVARAPLFPNVNGSFSANRTQFRDSLRPDSTTYNAGPSLLWELDVWGRVRNSAKIGELDVNISQADYAATRLSIAGATADGWFDLIESKLLENLASRDVKTLTRAAALTERRFNGGLSPSSDVRLARSSAAGAKATLAARKQFKTANARRLETLLRRYPTGEIEAPADLPELPALTGAGTPIDIFSKRPDLIAAGSRLAAAGLQVDIAKKNLLPQLTLNSDATFNNTSIDNLFDIDNMVASLIAGLSGPIFNAGARRADVQRNQAFLRQQVEQYVGTALNAYFEVENALNAEKHLLDQEIALRESLQQANLAEQRLERRYSEGLATILQVLDAQTRAINAESQLISARTERLKNRVRLHMALGGGEIGAIETLETDIE